MKRIRRSLKKKSGRSLLSLLLAAALSVGGMTSAFAAEADPAVQDAVVLQENADAETTDTGVNSDKVDVTVTNKGAEDESEAFVTYGDIERDSDNACASESQESVENGEQTDIGGDQTDTDGENDVTSAADEIEADEVNLDFDPSYGLWGGYDGQDSMNDPHKAGGCVGWDLMTMAAISGPSGLWWIDDYYVGAGSLYDVEETDDFSLKYQVEFHASEDLAAGALQIVIDASLGTYRDGTNILPTDIGIPYGTPGNDSTTSYSPFNYYYFYYDEDGNEVILSESEAASCSREVCIKIWNYRDIVSGSNAMFQVLYEDLDVMQIYDGTEWSLGVRAEVNIAGDGEEPNIETADGNTLSGDVDTKVTLNSVTKKAFMASGTSYTPELYTKSQVSSYIHGDIPEPYASDFDDYIYLVWQVSFTGTATQAYEITLDESTFFRDSENVGSVVGFRNDTTTSGVNVTYGTEADGNPTISFRSDTARSFSSTFYVVTAYSRDAYDVEDVLENDVDVTAHPADGLDEDTTKSASATTTWGEYVWNYEGDGTGITKGTNGTCSAYLTLYEANSDKEKDTGAFPFAVNSTDQGYGYTHYTTATEDHQIGDWIEGSCYTTTTVDDALYAYPNGETGSSRMLTKDDYYFSFVSVTTNDYGYDVWEDKPASPESYEGVDQGVFIYAMFYDADAEAMDEDGWEYVAMVSYTENGVMTYTLTDEDLARQPYRVKVVHSTANYTTSCTISLSVMLRYDSPIIAEFEESYGDNLENLKIENLCGIAGQIYGNPAYVDGTYVQDMSMDGDNYSEKDTVTGETLEDFTRDLYDTILQRDNANVTLTSLSETAAAYKEVSTENDIENGRILADYTITAYEAYYVTGSSTVDYLKEAGISLPDRNDVVYCDLLPYGMQFDASSTVTAGRIAAMNSSGTWRTNPNAWDTAGVTVTVEESDVITNWNGTGRTMVIFHVHYDGGDASAFYDVPGSDQDLWYQGFGISFQAYYNWTEIDEVDAEYNIAAYIVEGDELLGNKDTDIYKDDGSADLSDQYAPFEGVSDLNGDRVTDKYTNMYASAITSTNVATASTDDIKKTVRADADSVAEYGSTAAVGNGETYTYEITLTNNGGGSLSDVVIFDHLEYAVEDGRYEVESSASEATVFDGLDYDTQIKEHWTGTFLGVTTTALDDLGIEATVYYNASRNATVSSGDGEIPPAEVLTEDNGWYTEERFIEVYGSLDSVCAIAVDISIKTDGTPYTMDSGTTVSFRIHMQAPEDSEYSYTFNNPMYYSVSTSMSGDVTAATDSGNTVRVEIGEEGILEVEKELKEGAAIPDSMRNAGFTFEITRSGQILANQEYMVYDWEEETEQWISSGVISATDINGHFTLKAGQKAVFRIVDVGDVVVTEVESALWDSDVEEDRTQAEDPEDPILTYFFENSYRSPVYLYKTALTTDLASDEELAEAEFTFRILVDTNGDGAYEPYANGEFLYVTDVITNGGSPDIDRSKGEAGHGFTDENGYVTLHIGDIIAFFPCDENGNYINVPYQIIETEMGDEWINPDGDTVEGTTSDYGTSATIVNYYKYRNLILTKDLSDYDHDLSECEDEWTFRLTDVSGDPAAGSHWYMIDANGDPVLDDEENPVEGYLDDNGEFRFTGAGNGRRVVIEGLVEGGKYILTETNYDKELYETVNEGTADVTMPTYAITRSITITNKYRLKDLSVSKLVLSKDTEADLNGCEFTFTLEKYNSGSGAYEPAADVPYTIEGGDGTVLYTDENGQFILTSGRTALFDDIGCMDDEFRITETPDETYPQIFPDGSYDAKLGSDGDSVQFINGDFDNVASLTKKLVGLDETGEAYVAVAEGDNTAATLAGEEDDVPYTVEVTFGVYDGEACATEEEGELIDYDSDNTAYPFVYIKVRADGSYELKSYNGGVMTETLAPYDYIYLAEIESYTVKASESADMERILLDVSDRVADEIGSDQILSEGDVMSGSAAANGNIVLVNNISSANRESEIFKLMTETSEEVTTGSQITFLVQIYDEASGTWSPASGIRYITMDGYTGEGTTDDGITCHDTSGCRPTSGVLTTGSDGRITLTKTEDGYPYIRFVEDVVYANVYGDVEDGTLRIIESESGTDESWGSLAGYDGEGWIGGPALDITNADTFYNGNDSSLQFEVEKEMADGSDCNEDFTFYLKQILSTGASPVTSMDQILESEAGAGVSYDIYDAATGKKIGEGVTSADGSFSIKPGQYARFYVPEDTSWYVYEGVNPGYPLYSAEANDDPNDRDGKWGYADNASIVDETNGVVQETTNTSATGTIILTLTDSSTGDPLAGGVFDLYKDGALIRSGLVTDAHGQVIVTNCTSGMYYFEETSAPDGYVLPDTTASDQVTVPGGLQSITEYELSMQNSPSAVRYAVKIWGIRADTYSNNGGATTQTAGLTFGPALGEEYLNNYVSRETVIENGGSHGSAYCIHDMSWDEIIAQSKADPTVFADCRANGCTKAVELNLNDTLGNQTTIDNYLSQGYSGDGVSTLYHLLDYDYAGRWNYTRDEASSTDLANIYAQSRVRVTLNGDNSDANLKYASETGDGSDLCDGSSCLLSCFPEELQDAIVPRTVPASTSEYDKTTYDKLWLPARSEVGDYYASDNGEDYGIASDDSERVAYEFGDESANTVTSCNWWLRSRDNNFTYAAFAVNNNGVSFNGPTSYSYGLSPCFSME